ncbi:glycolate oxidase subunit GlcE [Methylomonas koyamae]|uniref:glycolate oxidase subunit GlcE n=1 Tax=Methylomonas koyamae TaxID=702114 RepID=UPI00112A1A25|nr:glycolate oxidase subunit GlcE [Methylomonas koyamae]TPQ28122.1 glycolate oxidase subunit GlcE [Methylomonas koyamae]
MAADISAELREHIERAAATNTPLRIVGGNSKAFYTGPAADVELLEVAGHTGIIGYEPSELVVTVRAGTRLAELEAALAGHGQMLGFEPPYFGADATIGGTLACGFSGPRRPFAGSARDFVLGCQIVNGLGEELNFGGQVIKNVAGFDVSRLMVGALGSLGLLLQCSLRVLPRPETETTVTFAPAEAAAAIEFMNRLAGRPWPLSALAYAGGRVRARLSGASAAVSAAATKIGGDIDADGDAFWQDLREQRLPFFQQPGNLWRIAMAPAASQPQLAGDWLLDWGGAQRWLRTGESAAAVHRACAAAGAQARLFRGEAGADRQRIAPELAALQRRVRQAFDPLGLFVPLPD